MSKMTKINKIKSKIKKDDTVIVNTGKDKGKTGKVVAVLKKKVKLGLEHFIVVEGLNMVKKHVKPKPHPQEDQRRPGEIRSQEMPLPISNVSLLDPTTNKAAKVGFKTLEDGTKVRYFKKTGEVI